MLLVKRKDWEPADAGFKIFQERLLNYADMFGELSRNFNEEFQYDGEDRQGILEARQKWESRYLIGNNLAQVASLMEGIATDMINIHKVFPHKKKSLEQYLRAEGIELEDICCMQSDAGEEIYCAYLRSKSGEDLSVGRAVKAFSVTFDKSYQIGSTSPQYIRSKPQLFRFVKKMPLMALTGYARVIKEGEKISGDTYSFWESENGRLTAILADGTGSGEKASVESTNVVEHLERMLETGIGVETAIRLLNSSYSVCGVGWNHPTLDICDIDLHSGEVAFLKLGGAASFIRRESGVEVIRGGMLPVGSFPDMHVCIGNKRVQNGDYIIMVSDGVVDAFAQGQYEEAVKGVLMGVQEYHPEVIAEELLRSAICAEGGHIRDDMTVLVIGIWEKNTG